MEKSEVCVGFGSLVATTGAGSACSPSAEKSAKKPVKKYEVNSAS